MLKVLSTKLEADEADRFAAMAEQQGMTKSKLLGSLAQGYLSSSDNVDSKAFIDALLPTASLKKSAPLEKTNDVDGTPLSQNRASKDIQPVYHPDTKGRPETPAKSSTSIWWLVAPFLLALLVKSQPSTTVNRNSTHTTQPPQVDASGLYAHKVGNTTVYTSSPTPFW